MQTLGIEVTFVVLSLANVKGARLLGMAALQLDLNDGLPGLPDNSYDGVVMLEVIEHIVAAEQLLREVARVLKPGGFLILSTPNFAYWCNRLRILAGKGSQDEGCHYRFFTPAVLRDRLRDADLEIMQTAHTMPAMGYNFIANRLLRRARRHVHVPDLLAPLFAHTLIVKSAKHSVTST
jgi:SAM-dependent methyltransferase